jgi:phosphate acyltransferase
MAQISIGIDVDNGDLIRKSNCQVPPTKKICSAVSRVLKENGNIHLVLSGNKERILNSFHGQIPQSVSILPSLEYCLPEQKIERPISGSSLNNLTRETKSGNLDGFFTIGDTSKVGIEAIRLGRLKRVEKPVLITPVPLYPQGFFLFSDIGATSLNQNNNPGKLYKTGIEEFAREIYCQGIITTVYAKEKGIPIPRIGLVTIGQEEHKGSDWILAAHELFRQESENLYGFLDYLGKIEPKHAVRKNLVDIALADGHSGNLLLKLAEGVIGLVKDITKDIKENLSALDKLICLPGAIVLRRNKRIKKVIENFNPDLYNAALVLGYKGIISKGHGDSSENAIYYGIKRAIESSVLNLDEKIEQALEKYLPRK